MRLLIGDGIFVVAVLLAWLRGGGPERALALVVAAMFVVDRAGHAAGIAGLVNVERMHAVIDLAAFASMITVMCCARRIWPIWATACQLLSVISHLARAYDASLPTIASWTLAIAPFYLINIGLIVGTLLHMRRLARRGSDRSWRT